MNENIRRILMLCTILTLGLILIFFEVTLIQLILLLIVVVTVLPFLLGMVTVAEVKTYLGNLKNSGILKRLNDIKLFEKRTQKGAEKAPVKPEKTQKPVKTESPKLPGKSGGIKAHFASIAATFGSLGAVLKARVKHGKKVEEINKMLDKTISEKVTKPAATPASTAPGGTAAASPVVAAGGGGTADASDPFLSLSGDDFDEGLLDGLDDDPSLGSLSEDLNAGTEPAPEAAAPELLMPSLDEAGGEAPPTGVSDPVSSDGGLDAFSGLDGSSTELDAEFGDLDSISLDDVEIDDDLAGSMDAGAGAVAEPPAPEAATAAPPATPAADPNVVKTAWIPSDAPSSDVQEDQIGVQSDMASFAGGASGSDEDLLSSIASDVKTVKKEKDVSLLRELKDFKAPATEIESELTDMFQKMGGVGKDKNKTPSASDGIK